MTVSQRLEALRAKMRGAGIDAYLVPTDDFHNSEYVGAHFKCREYITGFTGSAGTALIMQDGAWLWTDGRYFLQAASQLEGSGVTLMKMGQEGVPTLSGFLCDRLIEGQVLGFDGRTVTAAQGEAYAESLGKKGIRLVTDVDLIGDIWEDRPPLPCSKAWELEVRFAGKERKEKISAMRRELTKHSASYLLLSSLDDIAWLLNIRGDDVDCNPVLLSYLVLSQSKVRLFVSPGVIEGKLADRLRQDSVEVLEYNDFYAFIAGIRKGRSVWIDPENANYAILRSVPEDVSVIRAENPTILPKACKNSVEVANVIKAHIKDGVAVTRFIRWLKENAGNPELTELSAAKQLEVFRGMGKNYMGPSFTPIIAYKEHASIIHYSATEATNVPIGREGMVLCDTGGQYLEGTTDITRTVVLGETSREEKEYFTRVLQGHLALGAAKFPYGVSGRILDTLARQPLWAVGEDYNHGTGHGVGFVLNVHEGPQNIRWRMNAGKPDTVLEEGMITSNEPGYYRDNAFGIRHENLVVCRKAEKGPYGQFMEFQTLTMVPFDLEGILPEMLSDTEKKLLNEYHRKVYQTLSRHLEEDEREWLKEATRPL